MLETSSDRDTTQDFVEAQLNYLVPSPEKPRYYAYDAPAGAPRIGRFVAQTVRIINGRKSPEKMTLDKQGFELMPHHTAVKNFYDAKEVESVYYPEVEQLLKQATGAEKVVIFDYLVRCADAAKRDVSGARQPAKTVHNDYTFKSAPQRVRDLLGDEAEARLKNRFAEINVWRPIRGPLKDTPLALCDARSISPQDSVASDLVYQHRVGETYRFTFSPNHRWVYFPNMERDETLLLKCYDSKEDGRARFTAHTAFDDPTTPADAAPRESVEIRALVFWPAEK